MKQINAINIKGSWGSDLMIGSDADEIMRAGRGNDELYGGGGNDLIMAGRGDDFLSGGQGKDALRGGWGADTFCFDGDFDSDVVLDFNEDDGDTLMFIFYEPEQSDWTGEDLLAMCEQEGANVFLRLSGTDEEVKLKNTDLATLDADIFNIRFHVEPDTMV